MSNPRFALTAPPPDNSDLVPGGVRTYITVAAGFVAMTVLPALHAKFPWIPSLDVDSTTAILSLLVFAAFAFLRAGLKTSVQFILQNIGPMVLPEIERVVRGVVQQELANLPVNSGIDVAALTKALDEIGGTGAAPLDVQQKAAIVAKLSAPVKS